MNAAEAAAVLTEPTWADRLTALLEFLGIPCQVFKDSAHLEELTQKGALRGLRYAIVAPLPALPRLLPAAGAHSVFAYTTGDLAACSAALRAVTGATASITPLQGERVEAIVSNKWPEFTGPMHAVTCSPKARVSDHVATVSPGSAIIESNGGASFFHVDANSLPVFVSCSSDLPDLQQPVTGRWYDIKDHFFSAVPIIMYLKWASAGVCWQPRESGACLIIDDPLLRPRYGFCNFEQMDRQMQDHRFTTNIAFIPWNWRRTSSKTASLVRNSGGRLSISMHGCDHTGGEFGSTSMPTLHRKAALAKSRMERHASRTGVVHDRIMVFPQGVFSRESMAVLQQHSFMGVVNTEILPTNDAGEPLTLEHVWSMAILRLGSFPLFTRRYPVHGVENFAFDLLLGKPGLIVEHHEFFKGEGRDVIKFAGTMNGLNCDLHWRGLGEVIRRSYQWRAGSSGTIEIRMFANELVLENESSDERVYEIQKSDRGSAGVAEVRANGRPLHWHAADETVRFTFKAPAGSQTLIQVTYRGAEHQVEDKQSAKAYAKIAARRFFSEFRDRFLSRNESVVRLAKGAASVLKRRF